MRILIAEDEARLAAALVQMLLDAGYDSEAVPDGQAALDEALSGAPIPTDVLPHLFERFYRADATYSGQGYGLGLAIAGSLVTLNRGTISVDYAQGSNRFTIRLKGA